MVGGFSYSHRLLHTFPCVMFYSDLEMCGRQWVCVLDEKNGCVCQEKERVIEREEKGE